MRERFGLIVPNTLFQTEEGTEAAATAARLALPPKPGYFDELRSDAALLRPTWQRFFDLLGSSGFADLDHRVEVVARQIRENGITYNIYADSDGPARPWSLDLLPFVIDQNDWSQLEAGLKQRAELLNAILADVYGAQQLLHRGLLPPALVNGHPGYLRAVRGFSPPKGVYLHIAAFDIARAPDGGWWVVSQRTQAPSGLGYLLENRLTISRLFPDAFREMHVQHLATSYRLLVDNLVRLSPASEGAPRIVLLTPGPYNETYFEHAYLARYLGLPLVEGSDLTVREDQLFLKTLYGLERVHGVLRRLDDDYLDPLELRSDSTLGVPGLLQAMRSGNVLIANAPGTSFLESPAINGFLPAIARYLTGKELSLPSLSSWWCGEDAARQQILPYLQDLVVKPTYPTASFEPIIGANVSAGEIESWRARIDDEGADYTVQAYLPLSQAPTWTAGRIVPRAAMVRVFAIANEEGGWHILPGGLTRIASLDQQVVSMQRGGSSLDSWVLTDGPVDAFSMLPHQLGPDELAQKRRPVSSRAAENLFWMGRYAERAENAVRLARVVLTWLNGDEDAPPPFLDALGQLCVLRGLVAETVPSPATDAREFEHALTAAMADSQTSTSVGFNVHAMGYAASQIRDRLSPTHWRLILAAGDEFFAKLRQTAEEVSTVEVLPALEYLGMQLSAITGAQTDRMTRDSGWRLMTIGRQIERLSSMSSTLWALFQDQVVLLEPGFDLLLDLFDSTITYRAHYQRRHEIPALLDLLVMDPENPRSLACVLEVLRNQILLLPASDSKSGAQAVGDLLAVLPFAGVGMNLEELCERDDQGHFVKLLALASRTSEAARTLSDEIGRRYFSHVAEPDRALAA
ncbi:MAG: circularly permuted type 2 ATP-grasp protein [Burkholderiaceae bacterium]|jgi:uncharacterized circularly permuted ATP-grasp superfamily protein/uncharacterized alpha-E superfamily protein